MRDAKLEAMGLRPDDHEYRRPSDRAQMATDEIVCTHFLGRGITLTIVAIALGDGEIQEEDA